MIEIGFLVLGFAGSLAVISGLAEEDCPDGAMRAFIPFATAGAIWVASLWLMFQPMEMRAMMMAG